MLHPRALHHEDFSAKRRGLAENKRFHIATPSSSRRYIPSVYNNGSQCFLETWIRVVWCHKPAEGGRASRTGGFGTPKASTRDGDSSRSFVVGWGASAKKCGLTAFDARGTSRISAIHARGDDRGGAAFGVVHIIMTTEITVVGRIANAALRLAAHSRAVVHHPWHAVGARQHVWGAKRWRETSSIHVPPTML